MKKVNIKKKFVHMWFQDDMLEVLKEIAEEQGVPTSGLIRITLYQALNRAGRYEIDDFKWTDF